MPMFLSVPHRRIIAGGIVGDQFETGTFSLIWIDDILLELERKLF
jgi:hypothetical protein